MFCDHTIRPISASVSRVRLDLHVCFFFLSKGYLSLFNHYIDMRTDIDLSISCRKSVFLLENFNKNTFFLHEMDKLTFVLMSVKWLNKIEQRLVGMSYSRVHKSSDSFFSKILEKPSIAQKK